MPYTRRGQDIYKKEGGSLRKVQHCTSVENAKKALNLRRGVEHGWKPTGKK